MQISIPLVHGKVMEQIILLTIFRHTKDKKIGSSHCGFTKGKIFLAKLGSLL